jgi:hypothetical protein
MNISKYNGPFPIDTTPLAAILNSRQGKMPCGKNLWVANTIKAVQYAASQGLTVITSIGMNTWELAIWACSDLGVRQIIVIPESKSPELQKTQDSIRADFNLDMQKVGWLAYPATINARSDKANWPQRDKLAIEKANILIPVSLRPGGNLERLINGQSGKNVIGDFKTEYRESASDRVPPPEPESLSQSLIDFSWDHVCHWAHTVYGPWPGQNRADYYRSIANTETYPNTGLAALINIIRAKMIYGSSNNIRKNQKAVAFSNLHPRDMLNLMTWRKRYVRYNFEPYGIAIARKTAVAAGACPVIYGESSLYKRLTDSDKRFFQNEGENGGDWRPESEWRHIGDLDLATIPPDEILLIVRNQSEITILRQYCDYRIIAFIESD